MKYRIYIDEVGNSDLRSSSNPNHRFLSLTGVIVELDYIKNILFGEMEALKQKYLNSHPDNPIILHRKELINAKPPFESLRDPEIRNRFDSDLLSLLKRWEYTVISVCIDKLHHMKTYQTWQYDPYHYCLEVLLERYVFFLDNLQISGDVMSESRGGKEDKRLKKSFSNLWANGTHFLPPQRLQKVLTSKQLKVKPKSNNISGLQLADLIAHPSRNEILNQNNLLNRPIAPFANKIITILQSKYYQNQGMIYGKKFL